MGYNGVMGYIFLIFRVVGGHSPISHKIQVPNLTFKNQLNTMSDDEYTAVCCKHGDTECKYECYKCAWCKKYWIDQHYADSQTGEEFYDTAVATRNEDDDTISIDNHKLYEHYCNDDNKVKWEAKWASENHTSYHFHEPERDALLEERDALYQDIHFKDNKIDALMKQNEELMKWKNDTLDYEYFANVLPAENEKKIDELKRGYEAMKGMTYKALKYQGELMENHRKLKSVINVFIRTSAPLFKIPERAEKTDFKVCNLGLDIPSIKEWFALVLEYNELMGIEWDDIKEERFCFTIPNIIHITKADGQEGFAQNPEQDAVVRLKWSMIRQICEQGRCCVGTHKGQKLENTRNGITRVCYNMGEFIEDEE